MPRHAHHEVYGPNPHVIACISCNDIAVLTGPRGLVHPSKIAPGAPTTTDRFFPVVCAKCEDERGSLWFKLENRCLPPRTEQLPGTISASMLRNWAVYSAARAKFGVAFDPGQAPTVVVSRSGDWWREGILTHEKTMFLRWGWDEASGLVEVGGRARKDQFFGQPVWGR